MPRWFFFTIIAVLCWGLWAVISKLIGESVTAAQSQALSTLGVVPVMLALGCSKKLTSTDYRRRGAINAFLAGVLTCAGNVAYYHALSAGGKASTVVPFTALYPLVTIVLAMLWLRERLNWIQLAGIALSLVAIYLFNVATEKGAVNPWLIYALIPIGLWGVSGLLQKISTNDISGELSALWFLAAFVPVGGALLLLQPLSGPVAFKTWLLVVALGLFFSLGNFTLLLAFASAGKASIITPLAGLYPLVSVPIAILLLGETIGPRETTGIALALLSVAALSFEKPAIPNPTTGPAKASPTPQNETHFLRHWCGCRWDQDRRWHHRSTGSRAGEAAHRHVAEARRRGGAARCGGAYRSLARRNGTTGVEAEGVGRGSMRTGGQAGARSQQPDPPLAGPGGA